MQKTISSLRGTINRNWAEFNRMMANKATMNFPTSSLIMKVLHPEATPSDEDREKALKAFTAWVVRQQEGQSSAWSLGKSRNLEMK